MAKVVVRFFDDETLEGVARDLDFDEPDFLVEVDDAGGLENNETAWIPLTAVKWVELPRDQELASETPTRKVAIRFLDGEVLRGHAAGEIKRHRYGLALHLHPETTGAPRRLAVPFSAIKALFYVREFDGREEEDHSLPSEAYLARRTMAPLLDVLAMLKPYLAGKLRKVQADAVREHLARCVSCSRKLPRRKPSPRRALSSEDPIDG